MSRRRDGYNASARQSLRPTKRAKYAQNVQDTNAEMVIIKSKEQKEDERKERLKLQLIEKTDSKMTTKKKLRLEKYIEKKLKKEDRELLFQKLAKTQARHSVSLNLQSSSILGSGKHLIDNQSLINLEDRETRHVVKVHIGKRRRGGRHDSIDSDCDSDDHDHDKGNESFDQENLSNNAEVGLSHKHSVAIDDEDAVGQATDAAVTGGNEVLKSVTTSQKPLHSQNVRKSSKGIEIKFSNWTKGSLVVPKGVQQTRSVRSSVDDSDGKEGTESETSPAEDSDDDSYSGSWTGMDSEYSNLEFSKNMKRAGFKEWALQQLHIAQGNSGDGNSNEAELSLSIDNDMIKHQKNRSKLQREGSMINVDSEKRGPLGETLELPVNAFSKLRNQKNSGYDLSKLTHTPVVRSAEVQTAREMLPILAEEQPIVEAIRLNPVVVICGETGSGKTTQVPQFLYEAGFANPNSENPGMIGITQPRRVAAMSMAARVSHELSLPSSRVSYQIRYDATVSPLTSIKFMTDGVLLRELATDFVLSKYSVIIIDEAHERSLNTDILIGVLSRVIKLREEMYSEGKDITPLRLVIMSATMRVNDFISNKSLFSSVPPVINILSRQYPVTNHFSRKTAVDYVSEAIKKACRIHCRLPAGGILIFLTGQNEISGVCARLEAKFGRAAIESRIKRLESNSSWIQSQDNKHPNVSEHSVRVNPWQVDVEAEDMDLLDLSATEAKDNIDSALGEDTEASDSEDGRAIDDELGVEKEESDVPMFILPLYSLLSSEHQMRVFQLPPVDSRLVIVATNVAETSLTIPGIRYVIDCGRVKERRYDTESGVQSFHIGWISKASATQRAGRAGRTGPGHCYRLYSSSFFEHYFDEYTQPEIFRMPIESVVLQMKNMHINTISNFPFPTQPEEGSLRKAEQLLIYLGALSQVNPTLFINRGISGYITDIGRAMALFPLSPRFSKLLVSGRQHGCLPYIIAIVSAISAGDPFIHEQFLKDAENVAYDNSNASEEKEMTIHRRKEFFKSREYHRKLGNGSSDIFPLLSIVGAYEYAGGGHQFCEDHFVRRKAMEEIHKLRVQINNIVQHNFPDIDVGLSTRLKPPDDLQVLRQLMCSAFIDQVAVRKDLVRRSSTGVYATAKDVPYRALGIEEDVFIHPNSVLFNRTPPDYIIFQEILRSSKLWVKVITVVNPVWLAMLGKGSLCSFSKPRKNISGEIMVVPRFGPAGWELPAIKAETLSV